MAFLTLLKKQFTPTKLLFHFLFWVFHWGIFAYGWYAFPQVGAW
jgi:NADPH oxidase